MSGWVGQQNLGEIGILLIDPFVIKHHNGDLLIHRTK
jgi:hypothetical protein